MTTNELWNKYSKRKSTALKKQLVLAYLNLVKFAARSINLPPRSVFTIDDLMSIGIIGLNEAIERFDPHRGVKFETFAAQRIRGVMLDEIRKVDWLPRSVRDKYKRASRSLDKINSESMSYDQLAEVINMPISEFDRIKGYLANADAVSLSKTIGNDITLEDMITDDNLVFDKYEDNELKERVLQLLKELPERDRIVVTLYYYEELTFKEIGKILGISESRVSQIHTEVINRLRKFLRKAVEL
jgi:RNA polymerase sigma factor, FliA/WhiG family/RNA polymerase sigma factor, sigma-70 family